MAALFASTACSEEHDSPPDDAATRMIDADIDSVSDGASDAGAMLDGGHDAAVGVDAGKSDNDLCLEIRTWKDDPSNTSYTRKTWYPKERILVAESSSDARFSEYKTLKWRYASEGRIIAYIGTDDLAFQHDYTYDAHDNVSDFRLSYPSPPDLSKPSAASTWIGRSFANEYDGDRLSATTISDYGDGNAGRDPYRRVYSEDDAGRCMKIETTGSELEARQQSFRYDDAGLLIREEATFSGSRPMRCQRQVTSYAYDDRRRLTSRKTLCGEIEMISETHTYAADGSDAADYVDNWTDIGSERYSTLKRSAACLRIDADIGKPSSARCRAE